MKRVPFDPNLTAQYFSHPYWRAMQYGTPEQTHLVEAIREDRKRVIDICLNSFLGFCKGSPFSYDHVSKFTPIPEAAPIAAEIREIEYGNRPLIPNAEYTGIKHFDLFTTLCQSLEPSARADQDKADVFLAHTRIADSLLYALAASWAIERLAPLLAVYFNAFAHTWCMAVGRDIKTVHMVYIAEHLLTEGDHHIGIAEQMVAMHLDQGVVDPDAFRTAQQRFVDLACGELGKF